MIINITQHCTLKCPHCMQCAGPERNEFMDKEMFLKSIEFARDIGSNVVMISGGEPTSHPLFLEFLDILLGSKFLSVSVLSNGTFFQDYKFTKEFADKVKDIQGFYLQISSFKDLYENYEDIHKQGHRGLRLFRDKVTLCDERNTKMHIKPLGRASSGNWFLEAEKLNGFPSCTNSCLILAQSNKQGIRVGRLMESMQRFCLPIVSWDGSVRLGESEQCKIVANISEPIEVINEKLSTFRPCGGCTSYKWHLENPKDNKEKQVCKILWPERYGR